MASQFKLWNFKKVLNFSAERYLKVAGDLFIYQGDYDTALAMVDRTLEIDAQDTRALVLKGDILFCLNRDIEALDVLNEALKADAHCVEAYVSKASVLDALGKLRDALHCCQQALVYLHRPHDYLLFTLYDQTLSLLLRLRKHRQATQIYEEAQYRLSPEEAAYLSVTYKCLLEQRARERQQRLCRQGNPSLTVLNGGLCVFAKQMTTDAPSELSSSEISPTVPRDNDDALPAEMPVPTAQLQQAQQGTLQTLSLCDLSPVGLCP
ncbi:MAG: tetratricopeptide repeat protein [Candidatus Melainabacteria bacterium]|nr:tetratricopeptide repeat protein [Candidatus Melainabacteria bacterium]